MTIDERVIHDAQPVERRGSPPTQPAEYSRLADHADRGAHGLHGDESEQWIGGAGWTMSARTKLIRSPGGPRSSTDQSHN